MKRKSLCYRDPRYVIASETKIKKYEGADAAVWLSLTEITAVSRPQIFHFNGKDLIICDKCRKRFSILPLSESYCITVTLNENDDVELWYIDMIAAQGVDESGIPYYDDLYLDIIATPDGTVWIDDRDELDTAYARGEITAELYALANSTSEKVQRELTDDIPRLLEMTQAYYRALVDMQYQWNRYTPADAPLVDAWLDEDAIRETGIDDGWQSFYDYWMQESYKATAEDFCYLIAKEQSPLAVIYASVTERTLTVSEMIVAPHLRGLGHGSAILSELLAHSTLLLGTTLSTANAVIFPDNIASQKTFARAGFVLVSKHPDGDAWYYEKTIHAQEK